MPEPRVIQTTWEYRGYTIQDDGGHGFYKALNPRGHYIGSGEGMGTVRDIVDEHIEKVFGFWDLNCVMSPLVARAARQMNNTQAEFFLDHGYLPTQNVPFNPAGLTEFERVIDAGGNP